MSYCRCGDFLTHVKEREVEGARVGANDAGGNMDQRELYMWLVESFWSRVVNGGEVYSCKTCTDISTAVKVGIE